MIPAATAKIQECVDVSQRVACATHIPEDDRVGLRSSLLGIHSRCHQTRRQASHQIVNSGRPRVTFAIRYTWWTCARRSSRVVTIDVPTLLPMLRMKFTSPATLPLFSAGIPT